MGSYRLSRPAREDLGEILAYAASDNIDAALALNDRFNDIFVILARNPHAGRERPEVAPDIRSFPMDRYLILYRQVAGEIIIARARHSAMDISEELEGLN